MIVFISCWGDKEVQEEQAFPSKGLGEGGAWDSWRWNDWQEYLNSRGQIASEKRGKEQPMVVDQMIGL